jgi:predicted nucleotidyltransferase
MNDRTRFAIARRFGELLESLNPTIREEEAISTHQQVLQSRFGTSLSAYPPLAFGSYPRRTAITRYSDLDLLLRLPAEVRKRGGEFVSSNTVLDNVRRQAQDRLPLTSVGRDEHAIVIAYADGTRIDLVPAFFCSFNTHPVFEIPDGKGWWMPTSPAQHKTFIQTADQESAGKLKGVAKLVKFWRFTRQTPIPLSSIHLELILAVERTCIGARSYSACLNWTFHVLARRRGAGLRDPVLGGLIPAVNTDAKRTELNGALDHAVLHAGAAVNAESSGDTQEAIRQWNIVFNGYFPR